MFCLLCMHVHKVVCDSLQVSNDMWQSHVEMEYYCSVVYFDHVTAFEAQYL